MWALRHTDGFESGFGFGFGFGSGFGFGFGFETGTGTGSGTNNFKNFHHLNLVWLEFGHFASVQFKFNRSVPSPVQIGVSPNLLLGPFARTLHIYIYLIRFDSIRYDIEATNSTKVQINTGSK